MTDVDTHILYHDGHQFAADLLLHTMALTIVHSLMPGYVLMPVHMFIG
jgi:hypothetical protein